MMNETYESRSSEQAVPRESEPTRTNETSTPTDKTYGQESVIERRWWTWQEDSSQWDEEIRCINKMQQVVVEV